MKAPVVVKLGGSAITDKSKASTARLEVIHNAIKEVAAFSGPMILLHGGGSFAHQLTRIIGVGLLLRHRPFVPLAPMSFMTLRRGQVGRSFLDPITAALRLGLIPLIHGDVAFDEIRGCGIVSADRIASLLGEKMGASRVLFGSDVDGLYDENPMTSSKAELIAEVNRGNFARVLKGLKPSRGDVTGGMGGKALEALWLAKHGCESYVFNLTKSGNLRSLLRGSSSIGTRFVAWKK